MRHFSFSCHVSYLEAVLVGGGRDLGEEVAGELQAVAAVLHLQLEVVVGLADLVVHVLQIIAGVPPQEVHLHLASWVGQPDAGTEKPRYFSRQKKFRLKYSRLKSLGRWVRLGS